MDKILNRVCSIASHPIKKFDEEFRIIYLKGLGASLAILSDNPEVAKMFLDVWSKCILDNSHTENNYWIEDLEAVKRAVRIRRKGFKLFSMKYCLLFDCFYLLEASTKADSSTILKQAYNFFDIKVCGLFSRGALKTVNEYYVSGIYNKKFSGVLFEHRSINLLLNQRKEKRVLVVANVSAGKSTLINALVGYRINKTRTTVCTDKVVRVDCKQNIDGVTISDTKGSYHYYNDIEEVDSGMFVEASFPFNSSLSSNVCFIDTPGINNSEDLKHKKITEDAINSEAYEAIIYVSNCQYFGTYDERNILELLNRKVKKPIIFVLNQLDRFKQKDDSITRMIDNYRNDLLSIGFKAPIVVPVSSRFALLSKLSPERLDEDDLFELEQYQKKFSREFYDLPTYVGDKRQHNDLEKTGIVYLESIINNI